MATIYDQQIATTATVIAQCMTLGAVVLKPKDKSVRPVGF